jgi:MFS family permease
MFVFDYYTLMIGRFLLGCAEAGFVPGVFLYLTFFFLPHERAQRIALFISSNATAGFIGGLLAFGMLNNKNCTKIRPINKATTNN